MKKFVLLLLALTLLLSACVHMDHQQTQPVETDGQQLQPSETDTSVVYITRWKAKELALRDYYGDQYSENMDLDVVITEEIGSGSGSYTIIWNTRTASCKYVIDAVSGRILERPYQSLPTEPEETIQPTEPPQVYDLEVDDWYVEPEYLSYEEYFSEDRDYSRSSGAFWMKQEDTHWITFGVSWKDDGLVIGGGMSDDKYLVPNSMNYNGFEILAADGKYVYLLDTEIGRVNMGTGEYETLYMAEEILRWDTYDKMVTYFIALHENDGEQTIKICRMYLPTGRVDILHEESAEDLYYLHLNKVYSSLGDVRWTKLNPDYVAAMRKELANPDSAYKIGYYDNSEYWEAEDGIAMMLENGYFMLLDEMEDGLGVRAQLMGVYNCASGKYSEKLGIFDGCWYGSGYPEDHFNPDVTTAPDPILIKENWFRVEEEPDFALCDADGIGEDGTYVDSRLRIYADHTSTPYLYMECEEGYTKVTDTPIKSAVNTSQCIIAVSMDNEVIAMTYDGKHSAALYKSVYGEIENLDLSYFGNYAAFLDGGYLILVDLETQEYREVVYHENLDNFYLGVQYTNGNDMKMLEKPEIYFEVCVGLYVNGFVVDLYTGEMTPGYRL